MLKLLSHFFLVTLVAAAALFESSAAFSAPVFAARTSDEAGVRVVVTPKALGRDVAVWEFNVVVDTHIKPLSDDLANTAVLLDEAGQRYVPVAWQGDPPGGHHRKGVLQFSPPAEMPKSIELRINGVGGVAIRSVRWTTE